MDLNPEVENHIGRNVPWVNLPLKVKEIFGNSQKGYEKAVITYSIRNQLNYAENLVKHIRKDEGKYFEEVVLYSKQHLMLYPYHLSHRVVKGLRITPFQYYISILEKLMDQEKSYDSLPNFTAADCLRLLGIGRNQYIELMNQHRSSRKLFRKKAPRDYLPAKPVDITIEPWFRVEIGYVTEDDVAAAKLNERELIDSLIDNGGQTAGSLNLECVQSLYRKGLVYLDVPIEGDDYIVVPPLEGFVMNRVLGDYFETLLYKIFVSIDEHTTVAELAHVLGIDTQLIKNAVSLYCRLGFAYKKNLEIDVATLNPSWKKYQTTFPARRSDRPYVAPDESQIAYELSSALNESDSVPDLAALCLNSPDGSVGDVVRSPSSTEIHSNLLSSSQSMTSFAKRIAFLYDSTLTAFLMMGNLSPGLKNHAVTMFEVGKMSDESLDSFLTELEQISWHEGEGEALRYFEHAKTLRKAILFLRNNPKMGSMTLDLLRCESLLNLDSVTCSRLLNKNYAMLVSMAPLSYEVRPVCSSTLPHFGPPIPQVNSIWFKLFLYSSTVSGPPSLLLTRGTILTELPVELEDCNKYLVTSWGHDSGIIPGSNGLFTLNEALSHSAVFIQAYGQTGESATVIVPFPFSKNTEADKLDVGGDSSISNESKWAKHPAIVKLSRLIDLERNCGYITMMKTRGSSRGGNADGNVRLGQSLNPIVPMPYVLEEEENPLSSKGRENNNDDDDDQIIFVSSNSNPVPEPKNGFKDDSCAKIFEEELDSMINSEESAVKPNVFDSRQQKIESLRLELTTDIKVTDCDANANSENSSVFTVDGKSSSEKVWFEDWTLLDCQFGLPLFDSGVNQIVSERIVSNGLLDEQSLESLIKSNQELGKQLTEFISTYQPPNVWIEETPLPSKNFYCLNGRLREFEPYD